MNWGIRTALDPVLAVRSGSTLIRQASPQKKRCYHTVQEIHKAQLESQFSASQCFSLCKTNLWESPLTFTRGKHAERMSDFRQFHRRR